MALDISIIPHGIVVYTLSDFTRPTIEAWGEYVLSQRDNLPDRIRVLYDLRQCGLATKFVIEYQDQVLSQLDLPDNTRSAYLVSTDEFLRLWTRIIQDNIKFKTATLKTFTNYDEAVDWLNR
jgi:chloramphenicol O-acetyltransferase